MRNQPRAESGAAQLVMNGLEARRNDVKDLIRRRSLLGVIDGRFDWEQRYNLKYILGYARKHGMKASRLNKAIESLCYTEALAKQRKRKKTA
jgi:hypothetical protein